MKETIQNVLNDEQYATNDEKLEAILKGLATVSIPKETFNDANNKLKETENKLKNLNTEFENFKTSKMSDQEKLDNLIKQNELRQKNLTIQENRNAVNDLFISNGIPKEQYEKITENIVSDDKEKSLLIAQNFVETLNFTKEKSAKDTTESLLKDTPRPTVGTNNKISKREELNEQYDKAVKEKNSTEQARLYREMQTLTEE